MKIKCLDCGEEYTERDLLELDEIGEHYYLDNESFICPDCWDNFDRKSLEDKIKAALERGERCLMKEY